MEKYEKMSIEVIFFETEDVITTSITDTTTPEIPVPGKQ